MSEYGPMWPLKKGEEDVYEMNKTLREQISFELKNLLLTNPGENISDPNYGVGLRTFLFDQANQSSYGRVKSRILQQTNTYMPSIRVSQVIIPNSADDIDNSIMNVQVVYEIASETEVLDLNFLSNFTRF